MKVKSPPPPGAMYSLLLLVHMTVAAMANTTVTAGVAMNALQSVTHAEALTDRHASTTLAIPLHAELLEAVTDRHTNTTSGHIPAISAVHTETMTDKHTDRQTEVRTVHSVGGAEIVETTVIHTVHRSTFISEDLSPGIHSTVTKKELQSVPQKTPDTHITKSTSEPNVTKEIGDLFVNVHHSTFDSEDHSPGIQSTVTKKELQSVPQKTPDTHITMHHSTFDSEDHSPGIQSTVTKKELQSVPQKTPDTHITKSISVPNVRVEIGHGFQITCISERGPEVIHYELIQGDRIVKNMTVHGRKAATFQLAITPGQSKVYCRARTLSGEEETSEPLNVEGGNPDSEEKPGDRTKSDKEEWDAEPKFLISLTHILTSVSQPVQDLNAIIISVCGPIILILLLLVFLTHFYNRRGRKAGSTLLSSCV